MPAGVSSAGLPLLQAPWVPAQRCQGGTHQETRRNPGPGHTSLCSAHSQHWSPANQKKPPLIPSRMIVFYPSRRVDSCLLEILPAKGVFVHSLGAHAHWTVYHFFQQATKLLETITICNAMAQRANPSFLQTFYQL